MDGGDGRYADRRRLVRGAGPAELNHARRFVVVGGPGSGKTTVAAELAGCHAGLDHIELDGLWWEPGWREAGAAELRARLQARLGAAGEGWVVDGNYLDEVARVVVWPAADALVWLDLPRRVAYRRAVGRTVRRLVRRRPLWNGNRETARNLAPTSLLRLWRRWPGYGERIAALLDELGAAAPETVRLRSDREVRAWLASGQTGR